MKTLLQHIREYLRSSFWFAPGICLVVAIVSARALLAIDFSFRTRIELWFPLWSDSSPEGVRSLLSTIATSVLTLAGLSFSATLVALSLASSQFGPRLLRNFIRSKVNQMTLGILLGCFVFCLVVLRFVNDEAVPHLSALVAFILAIGALVSFIIFVHSIVISVQADRVVSDVYTELDDAIGTFFQDAVPSNEEEKKAEEESESWDDVEGEENISCKKGGYLQAINLENLVEIAETEDCRFRVVRRPGQFLHTGDKIVAYSGKSELDADSQAAINACFLVGNTRTAEQDFEFFIRQLVEIALRALSPGINDPFTAITCIDFLSETLGRIAKRRLPRRNFHGSDGGLRVIIRPVSFQSLMDCAFLQLRQNGGDRPDVAIALLGGLSAIARVAHTNEQKKTILSHGEMVATYALECFSNEYDKSCIKETVREIRKRCE